MKYKRIINNNLFMLKYVFKFIPGYAIINIINNLISAVISAFWSVYFYKLFVDMLVQNSNFKDTAIFIVSAALFTFLFNVAFSVINSLYFPKQMARLTEKMQGELFKKAIAMDLICYDMPEFYNKFVRATSDADSRALDVFSTMNSFVYGVINISLISAIALAIDPFVFVIAASSFVITLVATIYTNKNQYDYSINYSKTKRKLDYIKRVFNLEQYAKEVRLSDIFSVFEKFYRKASEEYLGYAMSYGKRKVKYSFFNDVFTSDVLINFILYGYVSYNIIVTERYGFSDFLVLTRAAINITRNLGWIAREITQLQNHSIYIENFRQFLEYEPKIKESIKALPVHREPGTLVLNDVSFQYEGAKGPVLKNISITIRPKEKIALVGHNGAGKSTLVKLLLRLYEPTQGNILLDGKDLSEYNLKSYRDSFGAVFQDFQIFAASIGENVLLRLVEEAGDRERIEVALKKSGFYEKNLELQDGIDTTMTKEFYDNGIILSGGESQKLATSRVFANECSFAILDEPSSALDPISEYNLNETMNTESKDKTVIFISHRLSATRMADRIYLLENGEIIEQGSHDELMILGGKYAEMFDVQAEKYR